MRGLKHSLLAALAALLFTARPGSVGAADAAAIFARHCASCHGPDRFGAMGPALLPESLERLKKADAVSTISNGRTATRMSGFAGILSAEEIASLAAWIYTPVEPRPDWGQASMRASRVVFAAPGSLPDRPADALAGVNLLNLFVVVEAGDHHVTILDGDRFEPVARFATHYALHGGPKFTADGRYVYFASRDGWVSKYDLWNLKMLAEVRAGINTRNLAVSSNGKWVMVANSLPHNLVLLDSDLNPVKDFVARALEGGPTSRVSAVYDAAPRHSFVAALKDIPEIWEISYEQAAPPIYAGLVHDFAMGEAIGSPGYLNPRRTLLDTVLEDFFFDGSYANVIGASRNGRGQVVNLDVRRRIAELELPGMPHLGSGITWNWQTRPVMATPNLKQGVVSIIDMRDWRLLKQIPTAGPGFFIRSHEATRYAWVDSTMGPRKDTLTVIDKASMEPVAELQPAPGKTLAHVEFTRDGRYALASLSERKEDGGAIIVFDAETLKEVKRIPMDKPVGKYNVFNKITRSSGTSH